MSYVVVDVTGLTCLDDVMYVVCAWSSTIRLYNTDTFSPLDVVINVDGMRNPYDIVVCRHDRQLYVADWDNNCIWRVSVDDKSYVEWLTQSMTDGFNVYSLSLTSRRLIVTSSWWPSRCLRQYDTTDTQLLCVVSLPGYMQVVYHGVETTHGTFVVAYRGTAQSKEQYAVSELFRLCYKCYDDDDDDDDGDDIVMITKVIANTRKYKVIIMITTIILTRYTMIHNTSTHRDFFDYFLLRLINTVTYLLTYIVTK